jgi:hypothetical protein
MRAQSQVQFRDTVLLASPPLRTPAGRRSRRVRAGSRGACLPFRTDEPLLSSSIDAESVLDSGETAWMEWAAHREGSFELVANLEVSAEVGTRVRTSSSSHWKTLIVGQGGVASGARSAAGEFVNEPRAPRLELSPVAGSGRAPRDCRCRTLERFSMSGDGSDCS